MNPTYTNGTRNLGRILLISSILSLPFGLLAEQKMVISQDGIFESGGSQIILGFGDSGGSCGAGDSGGGADAGGGSGCGGGDSGGGADAGGGDSGGDGGGGDAGGGGDGGGDSGGGDAGGTPYNPGTVCTPAQMQSKWVDVLDVAAYTKQDFVTNEYYLGTPNDIVDTPRKGRETINWAAYRNGMLVQEGVIEGDMWIAAHGGYGRGEATIDIPAGFDSIVFFSDEVGSDGNLEFVRGIAKVPEFFKGRHRITK